MNNTNLKVIGNVRERENTLLRNVYGYMTIGLILTAAVAYFASVTPAIINLFLLNPAGSIVLIIAQFAIVFFLSSRVERMSTGAAVTAFFAYAALTGISFSSIFIVYAGTTIWKAFLTTALMFAGMTVYAAVSKKNIAGWTRYLMMGLWGVIIATLVNMFLGSSTLDLIISIVGIVLFVGLTVWDTKRIMEMNREYGSEMTVSEHTKLGIIGALDLYLDFLNIFLYVLRLYAAADRD